LSDIKPFN